jgi:transposase-like protein
MCKVPLDMAREREEPPPEPADNEAFLAWLETVPDPERRYSIATSTLEEYQEMVSRLSALRAGAVADASEDDSVSSVARRFGVSRQRAHQLLREARTREAAAPAGKRRVNRQKGKKS